MEDYENFVAEVVRRRNGGRGDAGGTVPGAAKTACGAVARV